MVLTVPLTLAFGAARLALIVQDRQDDVLKAQLLAAGVSLAAAAGLAPRLGGEGAAIAILLGHVVLWSTALWFNRRCKLRSGWGAYVLPLVIGLIVVGIAQVVTLGPWLEAVLGSATVGLIAVLSSARRRAMETLLTAKDR